MITNHTLVTKVILRHRPYFEKVFQFGFHNDHTIVSLQLVIEKLFFK